MMFLAPIGVSAHYGVRSVGEECLEYLLTVNAARLRRVLTDYAAYSHQARPHQGLAQGIPPAPSPCPRTGPVQCRGTRGGLRNDYYREAA